MYYDEFIELKKFNHHLPHKCCSCRDDSFCDEDFEREFHTNKTLSNEFSYRLRKLIDKEITIEMFSGAEIEKVRAQLDFVGSDFIEVCLIKESSKPSKEWEYYKQPKEKDEMNKRIIPITSVKCINL
ncbi:hypothetical protein [Metabacillus litoralis]|uniref:hypothetical protein n=1 Tax=Metabacillus litoralis TaxID=152268 RepID=UPI00204012A5|nr:hypothetical protein [Metabacillus litoralis]MCM3408566.1 hypothetical protein [Metabacillus litoralis]